MTYDDYIEAQEDIVEAFEAGEITDAQLEDEMEALQNQWEEESGQ